MTATFDTPKATPPLAASDGGSTARSVDTSNGFRPGRSAHDAVLKAREYVAGGKRWVVDTDLPSPSMSRNRTWTSGGCVLRRT